MRERPALEHFSPAEFVRGGVDWWPLIDAGLLGVLVVAYVFAPSLESAWAHVANRFGKRDAPD